MICDIRMITAALFLGSHVSAQAEPVSVALDRIRSNSKAAHSDALMVIQNGNILIDERGELKPIEMMSATKGMVAIGVLKAIDDGKIDGLDVPVHHWYPEWKQGRKARITLRMLLSHRSGLQALPSTADIYPAPDFVQLALAAELDAAPGEKVVYNNKATNLLAGIVERATGKKLDEFMRERLFAPMGIVNLGWTRDRAGNPHGMAGLQLLAADAAKLGQLVLDRGQWQGRRLIRPTLIDALLAPTPGQSDDQFGLLWARIPSSMRFTVMPESIERLRAIKVDEDLIARVQPLVGQSFEGRSALRSALLGRLGDGVPRWGAALLRSGDSPMTLFKVERGPVSAYQAEGYLGQYVIVIPAERIVAVRQYRARATPQRGDDYAALVEDVIALGKAARAK